MERHSLSQCEFKLFNLKIDIKMSGFFSFFNTQRTRPFSENHFCLSWMKKSVASLVGEQENLAQQFCKAWKECSSPHLMPNVLWIMIFAWQKRLRTSATSAPLVSAFLGLAGVDTHWIYASEKGEHPAKYFEIRKLFAHKIKCKYFRTIKNKPTQISSKSPRDLFLILINY